MIDERIEQIQGALRSSGIDGWLFYDVRNRDVLSYRILNFKAAAAVTRRWYYFVPAEGKPVRLVHQIERGMLDALPGEHRQYGTWQAMHDQLRTMLAGKGRVAMQYSPRCEIPTVAYVDAGTVELISSLGVEVVSSAELVQLFEGTLDQAGMASHLEAGKRVDQIRAETFSFIRERIQGTGTSELETRAFVLEQFKKRGLLTAEGPIVAVNAHSGDPHYEPCAETNSQIRTGDFVLLDMWAKLDAPDSIFYDITWVAFCGATPDPEILRVFEIVRSARDAASEFVRKNIAAGICGCDVDDVTRSVIASSGFGDRFLHRTGHSIGKQVHGAGVNIDNFETHDTRKLLPGSCFSIEPGIYLENFGIRLEIDMIVSGNEAFVTGEQQRDLLLL